jgi:hypothetical protein
MIKEALMYLHGLGRPDIQNVAGVDYCDRKLSAILPSGRAQAPIKLHSLKGFEDYLTRCGEMDQFGPGDTFIVIESAHSIQALTKLDEFGRRFVMAYLVKEIDFKFPLGDAVSLERFIMGLMRDFYKTPDLEELSAMAANVSAEHSQQIKDTGVSQEIVIKQGVEFATKATKFHYELFPRRSWSELGKIPGNFFVRFVAPQDPKGSIRASLTEVAEEFYDIQVRDRLRERFSKTLAGWTVIE